MKIKNKKQALALTIGLALIIGVLAKYIHSKYYSCECLSYKKFNSITINPDQTFDVSTDSICVVENRYGKLVSKQIH